MQPADQVPKPAEPTPEETIPPMIVLAQETYERDLPEMLKTHYMEWVAIMATSASGLAARKRNSINDA